MENRSSSNGRRDFGHAVFYIGRTDEALSMTEEAGINIFSIQSAMIDCENKLKWRIT